jgi:hypothetical protein
VETLAHAIALVGVRARRRRDEAAAVLAEARHVFAKLGVSNRVALAVVVPH